MKEKEGRNEPKRKRKRDNEEINERKEGVKEQFNLRTNKPMKERATRRVNEITTEPTIDRNNQRKRFLSVTFHTYV